MNEFFKRNSPIFYIGIFVAVVFIFIIILGQSTPTVSPNLQPVDEKELVAESNPVLGFKDSRVTIVEFLDYNCPSCKAFAPTLKNLLDGNKNKLRVVLKHYPLVGLTGHESSYLAAQGVQAANKFGKAEDMHYALIDATNINREYIISVAERSGINKEDFTKALDSEEVKAEVDKDIEATKKFQIRGTPTIFINGKQIDLQKNDLNTLILAEINKMYPQQ
jgi:protein-disulfide isomerase